MRRRLSTISIVGRPNVGKSTLFNRLVGHRKAIVHGTPGVTRDRNYEVADIDGTPVMLVDTGGFLRGADDAIARAVGRQVEFAVAESDAIIFMVDGRSGLVPQDEETAALLRPFADSVVVAVNKIDTHRQESLAAEFYSLGFERVLAISAEHKLGIEDLKESLAAIVASPAKKTDEVADEATFCAIVGRPNVGKSSIVNALLGEERVLVHEEAGTTRDATDSKVRVKGKDYILIDTAGIRRRSKVSELLEKQSIMVAERSIRRSDVTLVVLDATDLVTSQDRRIASAVVEQGKGLILVVNKWDLVKKDDRTMGVFVRRIKEEVPFASFAPIVFVSAVTRQRLLSMFPLIDAVNAECQRRISTGVLNRFMRGEVFGKHLMIKRRKPVKFYFATQASVRPPTFAIFTNRPDDVDDGYLRYIEGRLREEFGFDGTPLRIHVRKHH
ncbi:MAG: ribosome biogenesis GTPase Der [Candidatus Coatesbacteria bacterium]|nr:MAG: ribosome biogenesis GTPase Der [Candidatus Coatesbacteria bacterium]